MQAGFARALGLGEREGGVVHAERASDMVTEITIEILSAGDFDQPADPVEAAAIGPFGPRLEHQRLARQGRMVMRGLEIATDIRIPERIAESGRVRQEMAQGDRFVRWPQPRNT